MAVKLSPPQPDIQACIQYAINFAKSVLTYSTVREVEYAAVWTIPSIPDTFKRYLFPLQAKTDEIVGISVNLLDVYSRLTDMIAQQDFDLAFSSLLELGAKWGNCRSM